MSGSSMAVSPQQLLSYLTGTLGYSHAQAAALVGNIKQESAFNPDNLNKGEGAYGLLQWRGPRLEGLRNYAASQGLSPSDWRTQLGYARYEMSGSEAKSAAPFLSATTVPAANAALHRYIRYGDNSEGTRLNYAQNVAGAPYTVPPPMTPGAPAPPLPPPINVGLAPNIAGPASPLPLAAAPQTAQPQQQQFNPLGLLAKLGGGLGRGLGDQLQPVQPPQFAPNPVQAMAMSMPPPDTRALQQLLPNAQALRGLIS